MKNNEYLEYEDIIAFHPGGFVREIFEDMEITQKEFADRLDTTPKTVSKLLNCEINLSKDIAAKLSRMTGISVETWLNLQTAYDEKVLIIDEQRKMDEQEAILKYIDINYFIINGWIESKKRNAKEKVKELQRILQIANLKTLAKPNYLTAYRNTSGVFEEKNIVNSNIMIQLAINHAETKELNDLNIPKVLEVISRVRQKTLGPVSQAFSELKSELEECGVILVALPHIKNSGINGLVRKVGRNSALVMINDKNKKHDIFWFSLLHELGHLVNQDLDVIEYTDKKVLVDEEKERIANEFACNALIAKEQYTEFVKAGIYSEDSIIEFANDEGVHPGIVLGRLQKEGRVSWAAHKGLKSKLEVVIK